MKIESNSSKLAPGLLATPILQAALSALILLLVCNWHCIYEEDQLAKTAQIIFLGTGSHWRHLATGIDYYSRDVFSAYYLFATAFYKLTRLPALEALNFFSILCGVVFFAATPAFAKRVFKLPSWLTWIALISAPILIITFNYGNEAALAIAMTALAALTLTFDNTCARIIGALCYVIAAYSRSDYILLWPALSFLTLVRRENRIVWRQSLRNLLVFTLACGIFGVGYLFLVLGKMPQPEFYFFRTNLRLFLAFFVYSPNLVTVLFAAVGFILCVVQGRKQYLPLVLVFLQLIPYLRHLNSPKYIVPSVTAITIFGVVGMLPLLKRAPQLLLLLIAIPWLVSVTPYGVFALRRSVFWYVPTEDGPLPTGGFLAFYGCVKQGFYQRRYDQELQQFGEVMPLLEGQPKGIVVGYFNIQTIRLWAANHQRWDIPANHIAFADDKLGGQTDRQARYLLKTSYLYSLKQSTPLRTQLESYYGKGQLKAAAGSAGDPFPDVIQCGEMVSPASDPDLGQRILFMSEFYHGNHAVRRESFLPEFAGISWLPRATFIKKRSSATPLYQDKDWVCLGENIPNAIYYSMRFPPIYSRSRQPLL